MRFVHEDVCVHSPLHNNLYMEHALYVQCHYTHMHSEDRMLSCARTAGEHGSEKFSRASGSYSWVWGIKLKSSWLTFPSCQWTKFPKMWVLTWSLVHVQLLIPYTHVAIVHVPSHVHITTVRNSNFISPVVYIYIYMCPCMCEWPSFMYMEFWLNLSTSVWAHTVSCILALTQ